MTRSLRLEFPGALYHVTARGDRHGAIYFSDDDREAWLDVLRMVCERCHFVIHAYCQMTNHYHLMVETVEGNLGQGMQQLNGIYTQNVNRRHKLSGHVLQGRYKSILVQKQSYLLELARYIVLNPVRAGIVLSPDDWEWSSHRFTLGKRTPPDWLDTVWLLAQFAGLPGEAVFNYKRFVIDGIGAESPLKGVQHQLILGDEAFVAQYRGKMVTAELASVAKVQRRLSALTLDQYRHKYASRDEAMARAYGSTAFSMAEIGLHFRVGYSTVSRAVRKYANEAARW